MTAILFDMDGVLVDSVGHWSEARERILRDRLDIRDVDVEDLVGLNVHDEYDLLAESHSMPVSRETYEELIEEHSSSIYREKVDLLSGVRDVVAGAPDDVALGVVSASSRHRVEMVLDRFDLADAFDVVLGADDIDGDSKPAPDLYVTAMEPLAVDPDEVVVVEDSVHGVMAARRAGAHCIRYEHEWATGSVEADETIADADELRDRLLEIVDRKSGVGTANTS